MIVASFGCYFVKTRHDHEMAAAWTPSRRRCRGATAPVHDRGGFFAVCADNPPRSWIAGHLVAQAAALDLAGRGGARDCGHHGDPPRVLELCQPPVQVTTQPLDVGDYAVDGNYRGPDDLAAGADELAGPAGEVQVSVLVELTGVAGPVDAVVQHGRRLLAEPVIAVHHRRGREAHLTLVQPQRPGKGGPPDGAGALGDLPVLQRRHAASLGGTVHHPR